MGVIQNLVIKHQKVKTGYSTDVFAKTEDKHNIMSGSTRIERSQSRNYC